MTTIAFKDDVLAADRLIVSSTGIVAGTTKKIFEAKDSRIYAGLSGRLEDISKLKRWVNLGCQDKSFPEFKNCDGILIKNGKTFYIGETGITEFQCDFAAVGSGEDIAIGVMAAGKSAAEAIAIASEYDTGTGGGIDQIKTSGE